ncbi:4463_t:CDS:2, partial [Gigaspora margarita]
QPFFINALNFLNANYEVPSCEVLSEHLLDTKIAKIINKIDKILDYTNLYWYDEQLCLICTTEVSSEIIANIAKSVFKKLKKEKTLLDDDIELSNPNNDLNSDEPNLNLKISKINDFSILSFNMYTL